MAAGLLFVVLALAHLGAAVRPSAWDWGVHQFSFLPVPARWAFCAALLLLLLPVVARGAATLANMASRFVASWKIALAGAVVAAACFWLGRLEFPFLGDGMVWTQHLESRTAFYHFEPLATQLFRFVAGVLSPETPLAAAGASSVLLGFFYVLAVVQVCRSLWSDRFARGLACILLLAHPTLLLFFGYIESYPLLQLLMLLFAWALHRAAAGRIPALVPAVLLGVAMSAHLLAVTWMPGLWALGGVPLASRGAPLAADALPRRVGRAALAALVAFAVATVIVAAVGASPRALLAELFGLHGLEGQDWRSLASAAHAANVLDEVVLLLGPGIVLAGYAVARGVRPHALRQDPGWIPVAWLLAGSMSPLVLLESRIGGARDWDLFAAWSVPAVLLAAEMFRRAVRRDRSGAVQPADRLAAGRAVGLALLATLGWLWVAIDPALAVQRFVVLQTPGGPFSEHARAYASETLAVYYRDRDWGQAAAAWREAVRLSPANPRYSVNLGDAAVHAGDLEEARRAFAHAYDLGVRDWRNVYNLALACLRTGHPQDAWRYFDEIARTTQPNWLVLQGRAQASLALRHASEALADLDRGLQLDAGQADLYYYRAIALRDLGDADRARASLQRALQLQPAHAPARQLLQQLGP